MPTRIVTARPPKRARRKKPPGPKLARAIVDKAGPVQLGQDPATKGDAADRLWRAMVRAIARRR